MCQLLLQRVAGQHVRVKTGTSATLQVVKRIGA